MELEFGQALVTHLLFFVAKRPILALTKLGLYPSLSLSFFRTQHIDQTNLINNFAAFSLL